MRHQRELLAHEIAEPLGVAGIYPDNHLKGVSMDMFTVYRVEPWPGIGKPLLVTAVTQNTSGQWLGEMYLLLEDASCTLLYGFIFIEGGARPEGIQRPDESVVEQECLREAERKLGLYREATGHDQKFGPMSGALPFAKTTVDALHIYWTQNKCGEKFIGIQQMTKSALLRERLALVTSRPKFKPESDYESPFSGVDLPRDTPPKS
jgi:hypothetical protein